MERLELQGRLLKPFTRRLFDAAGIRAGMKVLDVGCGAGDVAFLAAELVGSGGSVIGIDTNPIILETAQQRALVAGLSNVTFVAGDIRDAVLDHDFDAAVGRFVFAYVNDQSVALRAIAQHLRPKGIMAFQECDYSLTESLAENEATPQLFRQGWLWITELFRRVGLPMQMSQVFPLAFRQAGLPLPQMNIDILVGLGRDWEGYDLLAESLRSTLPLLIQFGVVTENKVDINTFAQRLRAEVANPSTLVTGPLMVGAWSYKTDMEGERRLYTDPVPDRVPPDC